MSLSDKALSSSNSICSRVDRGHVRSTWASAKFKAKLIVLQLLAHTQSCSIPLNSSLATWWARFAAPGLRFSISHRSWRFMAFSLSGLLSPSLHFLPHTNICFHRLFQQNSSSSVCLPKIIFRWLQQVFWFGSSYRKSITWEQKKNPLR